jgi:hypothetical protein
MRRYPHAATLVLYDRSTTRGRAHKPTLSFFREDLYREFQEDLSMCIIARWFLLPLGFGLKLCRNSTYVAFENFLFIWIYDSIPDDQKRGGEGVCHVVK